MKHLTLVRFTPTPDGTPGVLQGDGIICTTMERLWLDNQPNISCIPEGNYIPCRMISPKFGETFEIPVSGRTHILFHKGNHAMSDSRGCILVGVGFAEINKQWAITDSGLGFHRFMKHLEGEDQFQLTIRSA